MSRPVFLHGPAFSVGSARPLEALRETEDITEAMLSDLALRGVKVFCASSRDLVDMCADAAVESLSKTGLDASDISGIIFANDMPLIPGWQEMALLNRLYDIGIRTDTVVALQFLHCSAFAAAIEAAADLVRWKAKDNVLVLLCGQVPPGLGRLRGELGTVSGDGAAACVVSTRQGGIEFLAAETYTDLSLRHTADRASQAIQSLRAFHNLRTVSKRVFAKTAIDPSKISLLIGTYASQLSLEIAAGAVGVSRHKLFTGPMQKYGHVSSCDNIIALAAIADESRLEESGCVVAVGWSLHVVGVALFIKAGSMPLTESTGNILRQAT